MLLASEVRFGVGDPIEYLAFRDVTTEAGELGLNDRLFRQREEY